MGPVRLLAAIVFACVLVNVPARAQETNLRVGFQSYNISYPLDTYDISTATIDYYLNTYLPWQFPPNYTRDKANALFADVETMRGQLNAQLYGIVNTIPDVSARGIWVQANALEASFAQTYSGVAVDVRGISIYVNIRYDVGIPILCDSADGSFRLDVTAGGDYDIPTGNLVDPRLNVTVNDIHASCNGLLGGLANVLMQAFAPGYVRDLLNNAVQTEVSNQLQTFNMRQIFSARDFLDGLRNVSNIGVLNYYMNQAIDAAQDVVANPYSLYRAIKLTVGINYGGGGNEVRFIVSHAESSNIVGFSYGFNTVMVMWEPSPGTSHVDLWHRYAIDPYSWYWLGTYPADQYGVEFLGTFPSGTEVAAIGRNAWISEAHAPPGITLRTTYNPPPYCMDCPIMPE